MSAISGVPSHVDYELSQSGLPLTGTVIKAGMPMPKIDESIQSTNTSQKDERPITGTGIYNLAGYMENMKLEDSDNYSDDDFYSDEFEMNSEADNSQPQGRGDEPDREDDDFAFDETVQKGGLKEVVNIYQ